MTGACRLRRTSIHRVVAGAFLAAAIAGFAGCGGGAGDAVVRVAGRSISRATVEHWIDVEAVISDELIPRHAPPKGLVPDPPAFANCIAYQRTHDLKLPAGNGPRLTAALKDECRRRYEAVRQHVLQLLITFQWLAGEGTARGVKVSAAEVRQALARFRRESFTSYAGYRNYFRYSGETVADEMMVLKSNLIATKLEQSLTAQGAAALAAFARDFPRRWVPRTSCRAGYVVPDCRQYKGPLSPQAVT